MKFVLLIMLGLLFFIVAVITWDHAISPYELNILAIYLMLAGIGGFVYAHKGEKKPKGGWIMKNLVLISIAMGSYILLLVIFFLVLPIWVIVSATPFQWAILRISCAICAITTLYCSIWVWLNLRKEQKFKKKQDLEEEQIKLVRTRKQLERIEMAQNVPLPKTAECCDLDKMIEEIVNSPNKIDSLIAKAEELGRRYAFDEISELYKRVKTHLTKEEKIELLEELQVRRFVAPFSALLGPSSKD